MVEGEVISGTVERLLFEAPDSDYLVFRIRRDDGALLTVTGNGLKPLQGDRLEIRGHGTIHKKYGAQFAASSWKRLLPDTAEGIENFLASGAVDGIGPALAKRLVVAFGAETMNIMMNEPERLKEVEGIGPKKLTALTESLQAEKDVNELALLLETHYISGRYAKRLLAEYGDEAAYVLEHEPYRMIRDIDGIGFNTADRIALAFGTDPTGTERLSAGIEYVLQEMTSNGHVCLPDDELVEKAANVLKAEPVHIRDVLNETLITGQLVAEDCGGLTYIYTVDAYERELRVADDIRDLAAKTSLKTHVNINEFIDRWQTEREFTLADKQREAVERSLDSGLTVITGGPGTGKTTVVKAIIALAEQEGLNILLCAPTGRAAKRLAETTQRKAKTIHRLLGPAGYVGAHPLFDHNRDNPLEGDLIIVDEVSMLDLELTDCLLEALPGRCRCIFVGDADQLASVGAGAVLHDIIRSETVPVVRLDTIFRQQEGGLIVTNAHRINHGGMPVVDKEGEFCFVETNDEDRGARLVADLYEKEVTSTGGDIFLVQVLSPMYRNACGVDALNQLIQKQVNGADAAKAELKNGNILFRTGDKVMQKQNDYEKGVFNGDMGAVFALGNDSMHVRYPEQDIRYKGNDLGEISLAYAVTVHKSQGSEYDTVIIVLVNSHSIMLQRNLLYTAVTRAKKKVILVGTKAALQRAVRATDKSKRYTLLAQRLKRDEIC